MTPARSPATATRVMVAARTLGRAGVGGMVATALSRAGLTLRSPVAFQPGWVTNVELSAQGSSVRLWVTVLSSTEGGGRFVVEAKPLCLSGRLKDVWFRFVDAAAAPAQPPATWQH